MLLEILKQAQENTRLTYNCAHLRLTKESQIVEFGEKRRKIIGEGKNICCEGEEKRRRKRKSILHQVYTVCDSSNES